MAAKKTQNMHPVNLGVPAEDLKQFDGCCAVLGLERASTLRSLLLAFTAAAKKCQASGEETLVMPLALQTAKRP